MKVTRFVKNQQKAHQAYKNRGRVIWTACVVRGEYGWYYTVPVQGQATREKMKLQ